MEFYYGYTDMGEGIRSLSELVKEQLLEYDWQILESFAVLVDAHTPGNGGGSLPPPPPPPPKLDIGCLLCEIAVGAGSIILCVFVLWWIPGAYDFCVYVLALFLQTGSTHIVCQILGYCE